MTRKIEKGSRQAVLHRITNTPVLAVDISLLPVLKLDCITGLLISTSIKGYTLYKHLKLQQCLLTSTWLNFKSQVATYYLR